MYVFYVLLSKEAINIHERDLHLFYISGIIH